MMAQFSDNVMGACYFRALFCLVPGDGQIKNPSCGRLSSPPLLLVSHSFLPTTTSSQSLLHSYTSYLNFESPSSQYESSTPTTLPISTPSTSNISGTHSTSPFMSSTHSKRGYDNEETEEQTQKRQRLEDGSASQTVDALSSSVPAMTGVPAQNVNSNLPSSSSLPAVPSQGVAGNTISQQANTSAVPAWELCTIGGQQVTVLTDLMQVPASLSQPGLIFCGLTPTARIFFESKVGVAFDATRAQKYYSYNRLLHHLQIPTRAHAQQYRAAVWGRAAAYHDKTLATVLANDAQNAERWYNAAIDLSQMRDNLGGKGKGASRFLHMAENGQPHYSHEELAGLYFRFMEVVTDGSQNGFRVSTNTRHQKQVQRRHYNQTMTAQDRLEDALQAIRNEKAIFSDLLGAEGDGNLVEFAHNPRAYADVKNDDRRANLNRGLPKDQRKRPDDPDSFPWSEQLVGQRRACVYPGWTDIPPAHRITSAAAAHAYFQSTIRRSNITPDPTLAFFHAHLEVFARLLYDSVVSSRGMQDNATSNQAKAFTSAPPESNTGDFEREMCNIQAWCYLVCEMLVDGAANGFHMPQTDGQTSVESGRHTLCTLSQVFYGERDWNVNVFQRFGAVQMALVCSKAIANPFRGEVEHFLRLRDLLWEPLGYLETKIQHRKSNDKRKAPSGPRGGDDAPGNGEGSSSGAMGNQNQQHTSSAETQGNQLAQANNTSLNANTPVADYPPIFATRPDNRIPGVNDPFDEKKWNLNLDFDSLRLDGSGNLTALPAGSSTQVQVQRPGSETQGIHPQNTFAPHTTMPAPAPTDTPNSQPSMPNHPHVPTPASGEETDTGLNVPSEEHHGNSDMDTAVPDTTANYPSSAESHTGNESRDLDEASELSLEEWVEYIYGSRERLDWERRELRERAERERVDRERFERERAERERAEREQDERERAEREQLETTRADPAGQEEGETGNNNNDDTGGSDPSFSQSHGSSGQEAAAHPTGQLEELPDAVPLPGDLPADYNWEFVPNFAPGVPGIIPSYQLELLSILDGSSAFDRPPSVPEEQPLEGGSLSGAANTMPSEVAAAASAQDRQQEPIDDGSDEDALCESDHDYERGEDTGAGRSTVVGTPANEIQTPGTDYSDVNSNFK